jgi:hypothetical protein
MTFLINFQKSYYERRLAPGRRSHGDDPVNTRVTVEYGGCIPPIVHNIVYVLGDSDTD